MARTSTNDHSSAAGDNSLHSSILDQSHNLTTAQNIVISPMGLSEVPVPGNAFISNAVMTQEGSDLILESPDGITMVIEGYFSSDTPPNLISSDGKVMTPALVKSFIQASTDFAEDKTAMNDTTPVGEAHEVSGHATVTHTDGTKETIVKGTHIFEGDVIETDAKGAVNIQFADESSFAVSNNAKMAIDEFVFDTTTNGGENKFSVLRGLFVYTSGLVGREDPDDVHINTPVGSIGIRGTIITGDIPADGENRPASISVVEGAIVVNSVTGSEVILSKQFETVHIDTSAKTTENVGVIAQGDMSETFNVLRTVAPTLFSTIEEAAPQDAAPVDAPQDGLPAPQDAAPTDTQDQPAAEPEPVVPDAPVQLNLMNDLLAPTLEDKTRTLATETPLEKLALFTTDTSGGTLSLTAMPVAPAPAPTAPAAGTEAPDTPPSVLAPAEPPPPVVVPPVNNAPVNHAGALHFVDQQGLVAGSDGKIHLNQFFSDVETPLLNYTVTQGAGYISGTIYTVDSMLNGLLTVTMPAGALLPGQVSTMQFTVTANDGELSSTPLILEFKVYGASISGTSIGDSLSSSTNDDIIAGLGGNDTINVFDDGVAAFGNSGNDVIYLAGNNGCAYGDAGNDTISIAGGTGNIASGGLADDQISISLGSISNTYEVFGGRGNDVITLNNQQAYFALGGGSPTGFIDGGEGTDTLKISSGLSSVDLGYIAGQTHSIEKLLLVSGGTNVTLSLDDIVSISGDHNKFYIKSEAGGNNVTVNAGSHSALVNVGVEAGYTHYEGGGISLYVQAVSVGGSGIVT